LFFLMMLSGGGWSGIFRPLDQNYMSIASLIPESDAQDYFGSSLSVPVQSDWDPVAARRPLAQAFRDTLVLGAGYSYTITLLIQAVLIAIALFFAARSIGRWRGPWVATAFVSLFLIIERPFVFTTMTEPLSAIVLLATVPSLVHALASRSRAHAILAICGVDLALSIRMGAMLLIPAMALWAAICFAKNLHERLLVFAAAAAILFFGVGADELLVKLHATAASVIGGNFAGTLCGLSVGADWSACTQHRYVEDIRGFEGNPREIAAFLFDTSLKNVMSNPGIFLGSVWRNASNYVSGVIPFYLNGYARWVFGLDLSRLNIFPGSVAQRLALLLVPGLIWAAAKRWNSTERLFWLGLIIATVASASIVMADDGWRVLHVTHILLALLLAMGFSAPGWVPQIPEGQAPWRATAFGLGAFIVVLMLAPTCLHWLTQHDVAHHVLPLAKEDDVILGGGRKMTGFLVISDNAPRPLTTPALSLSQFKALMREIPFSLNSPGDLEKLSPPFALVWGMEIKARESSSIFYALPPEVLTRKDVWAWWAHDLQVAVDKGGVITILSTRLVDPGT
jgi:hypothetical protein